MFLELFTKTLNEWYVGEPYVSDDTWSRAEKGAKDSREKYFTDVTKKLKGVGEVSQEEWKGTTATLYKLVLYKSRDKKSTIYLELNSSGFPSLIVKYGAYTSFTYPFNGFEPNINNIKKGLQEIGKDILDKKAHPEKCPKKYCGSLNFPKTFWKNTNLDIDWK
jgi:hypothetical protein